MTRPDTTQLKRQLGGVREQLLIDSLRTASDLVGRLEAVARRGLRLLESAELPSALKEDLWEQHLMEAEAIARHREADAYSRLYSATDLRASLPWTSDILSRLTPLHPRYMATAEYLEEPLADLVAGLLENPRIRRKLSVGGGSSEELSQELSSLLQRDQEAAHLARELRRFGVTRLSADDNQQPSVAFGKEVRLGRLDRQELHANELALSERVRAGYRRAVPDPLERSRLVQEAAGRHVALSPSRHEKGLRLLQRLSGVLPDRARRRLMRHVFLTRTQRT